MGGCPSAYVTSLSDLVLEGAPILGLPFCASLPRLTGFLGGVVEESAGNQERGGPLRDDTADDPLHRIEVVSHMPICRSAMSAARAPDHSSATLPVPASPTGLLRY